MFTDTLARWVRHAAADVSSQFALTRLLYPGFDRMTSLPLNSAGLVINAAGATVAKTGATDFYAIATGILVKIAAATAMPALSGTVNHGSFGVFCIFVDSGGNVTTAMGTEGGSLAAAQFPQIPEGKALVGFIIINPTGAGNFVGGTTALDDATVIPNTVYVSPTAGFDPHALTGLAVTP